ncbi:MAG TPA: DUF5076 domain-containing protein [Clostridia bacterium]|nr:DUF5076 domain-containing protein [Clostridia bacterium]
MNELSAPPAARDNANAVELLRAWIVDNGLQCSMNIGGFGEHELEMWGVLLSDIARHVADAHHQVEGGDLQEALNTIRENFDREISTPIEHEPGTPADE